MIDRKASEGSDAFRIGWVLCYGLSIDDILLVQGTPTLVAPKVKGTDFKFMIGSDVIDLITFERGDIPHRNSLSNKQHGSTLNRDRISLVEFARYWYSRAKGAAL